MTRAAFVLIGCFGGSATAQPYPEVHSVQLWEGLRELAVVVDGATAVDPAAFTARLEHPGDGERVTATQVKTFAQSTESIDVVFVIEDGNQDLAGLSLVGLDSVGSRASVIAYGDGAHQVANVPIAKLTPAMLRVPSTSKRRDLAKGIALALESLERSYAERQVVVVVGNGRDSGDTREELDALKRRARADKIELYAVVKASPEPIERDGTVWNAVRTTTTQPDGTAVLRAVQGALGRYADRRYVTFPEVDAVGHRLVWDGVRRHLVVAVDGEDVSFGEVESVVLPRASEDGCGAPAGWWFVALIAGALVIGVAIWTRRAADRMV